MYTNLPTESTFNMEEIDNYNTHLSNIHTYYIKLVDLHYMLGPFFGLLETIN